MKILKTIINMSAVTIVAAVLFACSDRVPVTPSDSDLTFDYIPTVWDEAIPLGNGFIGSLIWQKDNALRFSLDRTDLWDLRPVEGFSGDDYTFDWVAEQVHNDTYGNVHKKIDDLYLINAAPTKIPGAALEFSLENIGDPVSVRLYLNNAVCEIKWANGTELKTFINAEENVGWFMFSNVESDVKLSLDTPSYAEDAHGKKSLASELSLASLGYDQGRVEENDNSIHYHQPGYEDYFYDVDVKWKKKGSQLYGVWSVSSSLSGENSEQLTADALERGIEEDYSAHMNFWNSYWGASDVVLPDSLLQKQYDNEMYKFGSAARENSCPISLQAVWTADNGNIPPWKGDFHHDLNTQLSYWPAYVGNHLEEEMGYLNTLWNQREVYRQYTEDFFQCKGLNVPGVCTYDGQQLGGWTQYAMSPTVAAWLSQHFYLHWKYSADKDFLERRAYPFVKETAEFLENFSVIGEDGYRKLPLSASPEIFDNTKEAWFENLTNYDLSLMKFAFEAASEMAAELNLYEDSGHWKKLSEELPSFELDEEGGLAFVKGVPYNFSHRHFSHAMSIHPLGLIDISHGIQDEKIIRETLDRLVEVGPQWWCGYSYSWLANMAARALDGELAFKALRIFAECFCLPNTFHVNGDQSKSGKSGFTYRPFTLEGNFAFASAIHEMLIQSHTGVIRLFPALPDTWKDAEFRSLRTRGAFLVSSQMHEGNVENIEVLSEKGGVCKILIPESWKAGDYEIGGEFKEYRQDNGIITVSCIEGKTFKLTFIK